MVAIINNIRKEINPNTFALLVTFALGAVLKFGSNIVLASLLFPEAFAIVGIVTTVSIIINLCTDLGFHAYIIRHEDSEDEEFLDTLWTIQFFRGLLIMFVMLALAWPLTVFYNIDSLFYVFIFVSFQALLGGISPFSFFLSERKQKIARVLYFQFIAQLITTVFIVALSFYWRSYWPLVFGTFLKPFLEIIFAVVFFEKPYRRFRFNRDIAKEFAQFSKYVVPSSILTIFLSHSDKVILPRVLDLAETGLYFIALAVSSMVATLVSTYPRNILYPEFAEIVRERKDELQTVYYQKMFSLIALICLCGGIGIALSHLFFDIFYDDRYQKAGTYLAILLIAPILQVMFYTAEVCMVAMGKIDVVLRANVIRIVYLAPAAFIGYYFFDVIGLVCSFAILDLLPLIYVWFRLHKEKILVLYKELLVLSLSVVGFVITYGVLSLLGLK